MAMSNLLKNIDAAYAENKEPPRTMTPVGDTVIALGGAVKRYFNSHPPSEERIAEIRKYVDEEKLFLPNEKYYIGEINYLDKIAYPAVKSAEEFSHDYVLRGKVRESVRNENIEERTDSVFTVYGRVSVGMDENSVVDMLPALAKNIDGSGRISYEDIEIFRFHQKDMVVPASLVIDISNGKVVGIKISVELGVRP